MKDNRRKIIIIAGALAVVFILCAVLACSGSPEEETVRKTGQEKIIESETSGTTADGSETEKNKDPVKPEETGRAVIIRTATYKEPETTGTVTVQTDGAPRESESAVMPGHEEHRETESSSVRDTAAHQETQPQTEPKVEATAHVHSYELVNTRTVEHPAVTEQVWVEDSRAWDEVIRDGYHVCVVTCHECGAQFADTSQAIALEAWGDHIDAVHDGDGGYDMAASYDVPSEVIHHDATGHYETRTVTAAWTEYIDTYRCSCGDSYTQTR